MTITFAINPFGQGVWGGGSLITPSSAIANTVSGNAVELAIDFATGDLVYPVQFVSGLDAIAQRLRARLRFFAGEWFLDTRLGIPYFDQILVKNPKLSVINAIFRKVLRTTPGVASVDSLSVSISNRARREGSIDFQARLDDGLILTATEEPFIVAGGA